MNAPTTFSLALSNEPATAQLMADLALLIGPGDVITLSGDLGAGKTAAARALIRYLADDEELEVPSPTFTLVQAYELPPFPLLHADLYRVNDATELEEIGLSPLPEGTVALIEWPERAPSALPADRIDIALSHRPALGSTARAAEGTVGDEGGRLVVPFGVEVVDGVLEHPGRRVVVFGGDKDEAVVPTDVGRPRLGVVVLVLTV